MLKARLIALVVPFVVLGACGGQSFTEGDDDTGGDGGTSAAGKSTSGSGGSATAGRGSSGDGSGGTGTAGTGTAGNGTGGTGTAGTAPTAGTGQGTGGSGCCLAFPTCGPNEHEVSADVCAQESSCHEVSICCSTIWCVEDIPQCDAYPSCDAGDTRLDGPCPPVAADGADSDAATAPLPGSCYSRSLCGSTVWCLDTSCDPSTEYNRKYIIDGCPADWGCDGNTTKFQNACGCGCEQDPSCPEMFNCVKLEEQADAARPAGGSSGSGAPPPPEAGAGNIGAELPVCIPEDLAMCPYSKTY